VNVLLIIHAAATLFMTGLIWFVQIVHYPLFEKVGRTEFSGYEAAHQRLTTYVVAPAMLLELVTAGVLVFFGEPGIGRSIRAINLILLLLIWGMTAGIQVPQHNSLNTGFDETIWRKLVLGNWGRTILWSVRSGLVSLILWQQMQAAAPTEG